MRNMYRTLQGDWTGFLRTLLIERYEIFQNSRENAVFVSCLVEVSISEFLRGRSSSERIRNSRAIMGNHGLSPGDLEEK